MLLTIYECSKLFDIPRSALYYFERMGEDGFFKVFSSIRITEEDARGLYDRIFFNRNGRLPNNNEYKRYNKFLADIKTGRV